VPVILPRRRILLASATALPVLLATAGCRSSDLFAGPDPLAGRPRPTTDVVALQAVITAEETLISLYRAALAGGSLTGSPLVKPLLSQHEQHLAQLRSRLIQPPGTATASGTASAQASTATASGTAQASGTASAQASPRSAPGHVTVAQLQAAEHASATHFVQRLFTVEPALAQLFASIAASDATHVTALGG
jgi:hypothetical protein